MKSLRLLVLAGCFWTFGSFDTVHARPRISFGVHFGAPIYPRMHRHYHPWCGHRGHYYLLPRPIYVEQPVYWTRPQVIVEERPTYVEQPRPNVGNPAPVIRPFYSPKQEAATAGQPHILAAGVRKQADVAQLLQTLRSTDALARSDAAIKLGRLKSEQAVYPLAATLAGDANPAVREAAARALGLIGSPKALATLVHSAQTDRDRDVRRSAQFAAEVIQVNNR